MAGGKVKGGAFERIKLGKNLKPLEIRRLTEINEYLKKLRAQVDAFETTICGQSDDPFDVAAIGRYPYLPSLS